MALTRWPTEPHPWLLSWTIWQLRGKGEPRPANAPAKIPAYAWEFLQWTIWRRKNRPPPRPDIIVAIPKWAYTVLKQVMVAVPLVPPPPPPPPANPDPPDSWHLPYPILYTSWGWSMEWRDDDVGINNCVAAGIRTIALQGGMFTGRDAQRCRDRGLKIAVWGSPSSNDQSYLDLADADGYIVQIESPEECRNALHNLAAGVGQGRSIAMITTFGGLITYTSRNVGTPQEHPTTVETEQLAALNCTHAQIEVYLGGMEPMSVADMMFTAERWRGLYYSVPVIGLAGTWGVAAYQPGIDAYGRLFGVYLGEPMRAIDWQAVRELLPR